MIEDVGFVMMGERRFGMFGPEHSVSKTNENESWKGFCQSLWERLCAGDYIDVDTNPEKLD
jgi:hypothetical protein